MLLHHAEQCDGERGAHRRLRRERGTFRAARRRVQKHPRLRSRYRRPPITAAQCPALSLSAGCGRTAIAPRNADQRNQPAQRQALTGTVQGDGNRSVQLLLVSEEGRSGRLGPAEARGGQVHFNLRMQRTGARACATAARREQRTAAGNAQGRASSAGQLFPWQAWRWRAARSPSARPSATSSSTCDGDPCNPRPQKTAKRRARRRPRTITFAIPATRSLKPIRISSRRSVRCSA